MKNDTSPRAEDRCRAVAAAFALSAALASAATAQETQPLTDLDPDTPLISLADVDWELGFYVKAFWDYSDDLVYTIDPDTFEDLGTLSGLEFGTISVVLKAEVKGVDLKVSFNPEKRKLRSTYVRFRPIDEVRITLGRFKAPFLRSRFRVSSNKLLFRDRTFQAIQTGPRDEGVKAEWDATGWMQCTVAVQNGSDGRGDRLTQYARLDLDALGGGVSSQEGAYGDSDETALSIGFAVSNDLGVDDGKTLAADLALVHDRFSLAGEILKHGDDLPTYDRGVLDPASLLQRADTTPFSLTTSWEIVEKKWEAAIRWEDIDDLNHTTRLGLSLNYYHKGHKAKWLVNWYRIHSDLEGLESDLISLGVVVGL